MYAKTVMQDICKLIFHLNVGTSTICIYLAGERCFLCNLIGSSISEHPAQFTSKLNKMASCFVSVAEEENCFE